jgi:hypothetical protein
MATSLGSQSRIGGMGKQRMSGQRVEGIAGWLRVGAPCHPIDVVAMGWEIPPPADDHSVLQRHGLEEGRYFLQLPSWRDAAEAIRDTVDRAGDRR